VEPDDVELLSTYLQHDDESAFSRFVERHGQWIYAATRRRLGADDLADDATQAVFMVLAEKARELTESRKGSLSPWLFHVMHFTCARLRREQQRHEKLAKLAARLPMAERYTQRAADPQLLVLMEDSIAQLPPIEREMIVGRFYRRQSFAEIGGGFGLSAEAVRKRISRSLKEIKTLMLRNGTDAIPDAFLAGFDRPFKKRREKTEHGPDARKIKLLVKETVTMTKQEMPLPSGHQMISAEFLVKDVEANLQFFEKLGFPRRYVETPDANGSIPRASLTAGKLGKIWIRRADDEEIRPSPSVNVFFWIDGGPDGLIAHRTKLASNGLATTPIVDEYRLPHFSVTTPDGYSVAFFTQYVPPGQPPVPLVL